MTISNNSLHNFYKTNLFVPDHGTETEWRKIVLFILLIFSSICSLAILLITYFYKRYINLNINENILTTINGILIVLIIAAILFLVAKIISIDVAAISFIFLLIAAPVVALGSNLFTDNCLFLMFSIPIVTAGTLYKPWASFIVAGICIVIIIVFNKKMDCSLTFVTASIIFFMLAFLSWIASISLQLTFKELKDTNSQLKTYEGRYHHIANNSSDMIIHISPNGDILYISPACTIITQYTPEEIVGNNFKNFLHPDDIKKISNNHDILSGKETINIINCRIKRKDGIYICTETSSRSLINKETQSIEEIILTSRDISSRKAHELEQEAIISLSSALRSAQTSQDMYPIILDQIKKYLKPDGTALVLKDQITNDLVMELVQGESIYQTGERLHPGDGFSSIVFETKMPYLNNNIKGSPLFPKGNNNEELNASLGIPLISQDGVFGILWASKRSDFTEMDQKLMEAMGEIASSALHRARWYEETQRRINRLNALRIIDRSISSSLDIKATTNILLDNVLSELKIDAACLLKLHPQTLSLSYIGTRGFNNPQVDINELWAGSGCAGLVILKREAFKISDIDKDDSECKFYIKSLKENFKAYYGIPLIAKGKVLGVLEIFHRTPLYYDIEWIELLEAMANQAAIALDNATLFNNLQRSNTELSIAYDTTLEGWAKALELRDRETQNHSQRVTELSTKIAQVMGINPSDIQNIRRGALLHDIGKMGIPDNILQKTGHLTAEEWEIMKKHPIYSYKLLSQIPYLRNSLDIPYYHHERWDGSGYPKGLSGNAIPLSARIFAVVDVWDALSSDRPYRKAWPKKKIISYIQEQAGKHFDPDVVKIFIKIINS